MPCGAIFDLKIKLFERLEWTNIGMSTKHWANNEGHNNPKANNYWEAREGEEIERERVKGVNLI